MDVFLFFWWKIFSADVEKEWTAAQESIALFLSPKNERLQEQQSILDFVVIF